MICEYELYGGHLRVVPAAWTDAVPALSSSSSPAFFTAPAPAAAPAAPAAPAPAAGAWACARAWEGLADRLQNASEMRSPGKMSFVLTTTHRRQRKT